MIKALKFDLFGKYAFFKNPEANTGTEFSFEHIHKPLVLGILGCILGFKGKDYITKENPMAEYYSKLKDIRISIVPDKPTFYKYKETITNTTGFANENNTQVLKREILQNVRWTIYIIKETTQEYWGELEILVKNHESKFPLYLGNNSYMAKIDNVEEIELEEQEELEEVTINSLFKEDIIEEFYEYTEDDDKLPCKLEMYFPDELNELNLYKYKWYRYSNLMVDIKNNDNIYKFKDSILSFI